jgi:hypothetical protein
MIKFIYFFIFNKTIATLIKVLAYAKIFVLNLVIIIHQYHAKVN